MGKKRRAAILPTNIILLQNVVRRDPESYHEEFMQQYAHYESLRDIFMMNPSAHEGDDFSDLIGFMSAVCGCYPKETAKFPDELKAILTNNHRDLTPELREKIIQCLVMLRNKEIITAESLIQTIFPLLTAYSGDVSSVGMHAKALRHQVYSTMITLLKAVNTGAKHQKLNRSTQALLFNLLEQKDSQGLWATKLTRELWRRGIWDDSRTVELMTQAALHPDAKVAVAGAKFFLGADKEREANFEDDSDDDDYFDMAALRHKMAINKKSSKRGKKLETAVKVMKKKTNAKHSATYLNFSAIHLLRDPQGFAEAMFDNHLSGKSSNRFDLEQKILFMNLISRLIGTHKLTVLGIYSFFLKYLTPKQRDVTQIMAAAAQASHDLVPPESVGMMIKKLADEFVSDGVAAEVAAAGLNTIREILSRAPLAIDSTLLHDLTEYKGSKAKPVMTAARSLISLYREIAPEMLQRRDRGKVASMELQGKGGNSIAAVAENAGTLQFGVEANTTTGIPGLELLAKWKLEQAAKGIDHDEDADENWEVEDVDNASDVEGNWVKVESDKEYDLSDDELAPKKTSEERKIAREEAKRVRRAKRARRDEGSDLELSDDEAMPERKKAKDLAAEAKLQVKREQEKAMMEMLSSSILTPADFAKLEELRVEAGLEKVMGKTLTNEESVDAKTLVGASKFKQLREERIAAAQEGREEREKFGSRKGKRDAPHSTTNREKERAKNFVMLIHKKEVQAKVKMSLRDKQVVNQAHITHIKKKGY